MPIIDESFTRPDSDTPSNDSGSALLDEDTPCNNTRPSPLDLLGGSVPPNIPSPQILPDQTDFIRFSPSVKGKQKFNSIIVLELASSEMLNSHIKVTIADKSKQSGFEPDVLHKNFYTCPD